MNNSEFKNDLKSKKYFLLDLDGTLYRGSKLFPYSKKFINELHNTGRKPIYLSNNSSRSTAEYLQKLNKIGLNPRPDEIYTSLNATIEYLLDRKFSRIYLMATPAVEREFIDAGFKLTSPPQAVVLTFDTTFNYEKFCTAYEYILAGVSLFATHPDMLVPTTDGFHPDVGTLLMAFESAIKAAHQADAKSQSPFKPIIIGKPFSVIYKQLQAKLKCAKREMIMIGDRLYTDIKGANDYGITSALVLSGETDLKMLKKSKIKPKIVLKDLSQINLKG